MNRSDQINELAAAMAKAQAKIEGAAKDKTNPAFRSKYADLGAVWDAVRAPLSENGLAVVQFPRKTESGVEVETILMHSSGQWMSDTLAFPISKADAHGHGGGITYARRFSLQSICGVAPVDDDGNAAVGHGENFASRANAGLRQAHEEIVAQTGETRSTYQIAKDKKAAKISPKEWADQAIQTLNTAGTLEQVTTWWKANDKALQALQADHVAEYERVAMVADDARASLRNHQ